MTMTPSQILNELHRKNREHIGTVERFEPTQADKISRSIVQDLTAIAALGFVLLVLGGWIPELWRFAQ